MTGARGNFFPPSFEPLWVRFVGEGSPLGEVVLSDEIKSVVVVGVLYGVVDWNTKGQNGQHGEEESGCSQRNQLEWRLYP